LLNKRVLRYFFIVLVACLIVSSYIAIFSPPYLKIIAGIAPLLVMLVTIYTVIKLFRLGEQGGVYEKIMEKYNSIIVNSKAVFSGDLGKATIQVETIEDLVKVSNLSSQPIIHYQEGSVHYFHIVLANERVYEYKLGLNVADSLTAPPETRITIEMKDLEDVAKMAEILTRPVLHYKGADFDIYYIIDYDTKYQSKRTSG